MKKYILMTSIAVLAFGMASESWAVCTTKYYYYDGSMSTEFEFERMNDVKAYIKDCTTTRVITEYEERYGEEDPMDRIKDGKNTLVKTEYVNKHQKTIRRW